MYRAIILGLVFLSLSGLISAQKPNIPAVYKEFKITDCFDKSTYKRGIQMDSIKANEVMLSQRVWRVVSLQDEGNNAAFNVTHGCEQVSLFEVIKYGLLELHLNAFNSDNFYEVSSSRLTEAQVNVRMHFRDSSVNVAFDRDGNETKEVVVVNRFYQGSDVQSFLMKEDWFFHARTGETIKLIVGIAPLVYDVKSEKVLPLFWLYYPEWKGLFARFSTINVYDNYPQTYKQIFDRRKFFSQIVKENNLYDRSVRATTHGDQIMQETERAKEKLSKRTVDYFEE